MKVGEHLSRVIETDFLSRREGPMRTATNSGCTHRFGEGRAVQTLGFQLPTPEGNSRGQITPALRMDNITKQPNPTSKIDQYPWTGPNCGLKKGQSRQQRCTGSSQRESYSRSFRHAKYVRHSPFRGLAEGCCGGGGGTVRDAQFISSHFQWSAKLEEYIRSTDCRQ